MHIRAYKGHIMGRISVLGTFKGHLNYYLKLFRLINKQNVRGRMTVTGC